MTIIASVLCLTPAAPCVSIGSDLPAVFSGAAADAAGSTPAAQHRRPVAKATAPAPRDLTQSVGIVFTGIWGTTSNRTDFASGMSCLDWPMDFQLVGAEYRAAYRGLAELGISLSACPWTRSISDMEDIDLLNESFFGYWAHDGVDIHSTSTTDSKAFIMDADLRVFLLSSRYASLGLILGYQYQELDYKTYDVRQTGYGPWAPMYTVSLAGPASTYTLNQESCAVGLTWRLKADERASITVDTAVLPYVSFSDEDNHLLRYRLSRNECNGTGTLLALNLKLALTGGWFVTSSCSRVRNHTDGSQRLYWWGDDPGSPGDETGMSMGGIAAEVDQDSFSIGLSLGCSL
jgi:hypothetical protein